MYNRTEVKKWAKSVIKGRWFLGFLVYLCPMAAYFAIRFVSEAIAALAVYFGASPFVAIVGMGLVDLAFFAFVIMPLSVSISFYFLRTFRQDSPSFGLAFSAFAPSPGYAHCLSGMLWMGLWVTLWSLLPTVGMLFLPLMASLVDTAPMLSVYLILPSAVISILLTIFVSVKVISYVFVPFILAEYPEMGARRALNMSKIMTKGYKWALIVLGLSFFGWIILSTITLGILFIYVLPYMLTSWAGAYDRIKMTCIDEGRFKGMDGFESVWSQVDSI